jgi:hypothetical protein
MQGEADDETGTGLIDLFECMASRDDATTDSERDYWRGYIDAHCDAEHLDREACEAEYQRIQQVARETMPP